MTGEPVLSVREEIIRKAIHLSAVVIPVGYFFLPRTQLGLIVTFGFIIAVVVEWLRRHSRRFAVLFLRWLGPLLRGPETTGLTGATYLLLGALLSILLFPRETAQFCLFTVVISDACAALVGRLAGRHPLTENKTLEGTAAFFVCTLFFGLFFLQKPIFDLVLISAGIALSELALTRSYDNLLLPLISGALAVFVTF